MIKKRNTVSKNFLILITFMSVIVVCITYFVYSNAISTMKEEVSNINRNRLLQLESNLTTLIERTDRLASSICVQDDSIMFWGNESPESFDDDFYRELAATLKGYVYSMRNSISSIVIYSPVYNRIIDQDMSDPYHIKNYEEIDSINHVNAQWILAMDQSDMKTLKDRLMLHALNDSYPYVMTVMKQYKFGNVSGAVAIDINLEKAYSVIWPDTVENVSVWVLDEEGRVIITEKKKTMFESVDRFDDLVYFQKTHEDISVIIENEKVPVAYAQRYVPECGVYVVVATELSDLNRQMSSIAMEALAIGFLGVGIACVLVWMYVTFASKPLTSILSLLENPSNYHEYMDQSEEDVQKIVDYIVSNLLMNSALETELEKRIDLLHHTQLQALKAQINPHFLFNALNMIVMMIDAELEDSTAAQVTDNLAKVLQYSLSNDDLVTLEDELNHTKKYVYIMEQRYKGRFQTCYEIDPELLQIRVPKFTLQPLIENAVFHGIVAKDDRDCGVIRIIASKEKTLFDGEEIHTVRLEVLDTGKGMSSIEIDRVTNIIDADNITMSHIGIQNVAKRLSLLFPKKSKIAIESKENEGTRITLIFPYLA